MSKLILTILGVIGVILVCTIIFLAISGGIQEKHAENLSMSIYNVHKLQFIGVLEEEELKTNYDVNDFKKVTGYDQLVRFTLRSKDDYGNTISDGHTIPNDGVKKKLTITKAQYDAAMCTDIPEVSIIFLYWPPSLFAQENGQTVAYTIRAVSLSCNAIQFGPNPDPENPSLMFDKFYSPNMKLPDPKNNPLLQLDCNLFARGTWQTNKCQLGWQYANFQPIAPGPNMRIDPDTGKHYTNYCVFAGTKGLYMQPQAWGKCTDGPQEKLMPAAK